MMTMSVNVMMKRVFFKKAFQDGGILINIGNSFFISVLMLACYYDVNKQINMEEGA